MEPYRSYFPHAGLVLPETEKMVKRVLSLPTGTAVSAAFGRVPVTGDTFNVVYANLSGGQTLTVTGQTGTTCLFTLAAERGTYVTVPAKSTGQFKDATGHGTYVITLNIGAALPTGKTVCALSDFGKNGPKAIPTGTSFVFHATGPLSVTP